MVSVGARVHVVLVTAAGGGPVHLPCGEPRGTVGVGPGEMYLSVGEGCGIEPLLAPCRKIRRLGIGEDGKGGFCVVECHGKGGGVPVAAVVRHVYGQDAVAVLVLVYGVGEGPVAPCVVGVGW